MTDINRELAGDAALEYPFDERARWEFANGWLCFCEHGGARVPQNFHAIAGYIAARDAPDE